MAADPDPRRWVRDLHVPFALPRMGPGPRRAYPDSRELSAQLAAREGSGAATCHAVRGRGRRSRRRSGGSSGRRGRYCGRYHPLGVAWRYPEGPTGQGLVQVKAGAASEGRAHAIRGLRGRESTKEVWGVGSIVAGAVPSTSCTASQVPTVSPQRPEWRSSDRSWRTRLRSPPLWGMAA